MSSPEKSVAKQLIASGVVSGTDYLTCMPYSDEGAEESDKEELEIELNEDGPAFLQGHSR